jgi:hypothetical protein
MFEKRNKDLKESMGFPRDMGHKVPNLAEHAGLDPLDPILTVLFQDN